MAHQTDAATAATRPPLSLLQRGALKLSEVLARWVEASTLKRQASQDSAADGGARQRYLLDVERRRDEAVMQRLQLPRQS